MTTDIIIFEEIVGQQGNIGLITLNRQQALNALNHDMFIAIYKHLKEWERQQSIKAVIIRAAEGRAFSAGGDIRRVYEGKIKNDPYLVEFFSDEYKVNKLIFHYPKPYIALLDGITMGGGVGISIHGSHRIATEQMVFAMPETTIGFYPDVGASYFLSRLPNEIGLYLGLTGEKIDYTDCYALGLVDIVIERNSQEKIIQTLAESPLFLDNIEVKKIINHWSIAVPESTLLCHQSEIQSCFSKNSVEEIIETLEKYGTDWCTKTADILKKKSPTSLLVTLNAIRKGKNLDFDDCMKMEEKITQRMVQAHDFYEGIRAVIIDKDKNPRWQPEKLEEVKHQDVTDYFNS
jgi:enoyl-CoA hydratase